MPKSSENYNLWHSANTVCDIAPLVIDHYLPDDRTCSHYSTLQSIIWAPSLSWFFNNTNGGIQVLWHLRIWLEACMPIVLLQINDSEWFVLKLPFVLICAMNAMWPANAAHFKMCQSWWWESILHSYWVCSWRNIHFITCWCFNSHNHIQYNQLF